MLKDEIATLKHYDNLFFQNHFFENIILGIPLRVEI